MQFNHNFKNVQLLTRQRTISSASNQTIGTIFDQTPDNFLPRMIYEQIFWSLSVIKECYKNASKAPDEWQNYGLGKEQWHSDCVSGTKLPIKSILPSLTFPGRG